MESLIMDAHGRPLEPRRTVEATRCAIAAAIALPDEEGGLAVIQEMSAHVILQ